MNATQTHSSKFVSIHFPFVVKDLEIKALLRNALTDQIHDRALFIKGINESIVEDTALEWSGSWAMRTGTGRTSRPVNRLRGGRRSGSRTSTARTNAGNCALSAVDYRLA